MMSGTICVNANFMKNTLLNLKIFAECLTWLTQLDRALILYIKSIPISALVYVFGQSLKFPCGVTKD
jgi:hypothetical protein